MKLFSKMKRAQSGYLKLDLSASARDSEADNTSSIPHQTATPVHKAELARIKAVDHALKNGKPTAKPGRDPSGLKISSAACPVIPYTEPIWDDELVHWKCYEMETDHLYFFNDYENVWFEGDTDSCVHKIIRRRTEKDKAERRQRKALVEQNMSSQKSRGKISSFFKL